MNTVQFKTVLESNIEKRTKCLVYTRVMGYHRPVESFNKGKKSNLYVRIQDDSGSTININFDKFDAQYAVKYAIPINKREDGIQRDISDVINFLITQ